MSFQVRNREELKRLRKLCSTLDNSTVSFPLTVYSAEHETVAFMEARPEREFSVRTVGGRARFTMSDRPGAREAWEESREAKTK